MQRNRIKFIAALVLFVVSAVGGSYAWDRIVHGSGVYRGPGSNSREVLISLLMVMLLVVNLSLFISYRRDTKATVVSGSTDDALRLISAFLIFLLIIALIIYTGLFVVLNM